MNTMKTLLVFVEVAIIFWAINGKMNSDVSDTDLN